MKIGSNPWKAETAWTAWHYCCVKFFSSHYPRKPNSILSTEERPVFPNVYNINYTNEREILTSKSKHLGDVVGIVWSRSGAVSLEYSASLKWLFSTFIHMNLLFKCVCSQGSYQLEAKFTAFTDWGTNELLFSQSKVKAYMKQVQ